VQEYCPACGQRNVETRVPARALVQDAVEDGLSLDSRIGRTVGPFLLRPGFLTAEWAAGRRARYSSPLRMYLLTSAVFFVATGLAGDMGPRLAVDGRVDEATRQEVRRELGAAGIPADLEAAAPGTRDEGRVPAGTEEQHRKLRAQGWLGRTIDDRWQALGRMSREELQARLGTAFREWAPRAAFFLVPAAVLILALLWRRRWLSEHVVLALHLHAFAFAVFSLLLGARLLPWQGPRSVLEPVLLAAIPIHVALAVRRVYGESWAWTLPKMAVGGALYLVALGVGMAAVAALALYLA
jgi:hypothetical protein